MDAVPHRVLRLIAKITNFIGFAAAVLLDEAVAADLIIQDRAVAPAAAEL
jgi:hypothetical protein